MKSIFFFVVFHFLHLQGHAVEPDDILTFWFGKLSSPNQWNTEKATNWFMGGEAFDALIQTTFEEDISKALSGEYIHWKETPHGMLALIILLDQFPRNIFRGTPKAFATDSLALEIALEGIDKGFEQKLYPIERQFFYMPLMHSEEIKLQQRSLEVFGQLLRDSPAEKKDYFSGVYAYAKDHYELIERFTRFPHRNAILGRESNEGEITFLNESTATYGQTISK